MPDIDTTLSISDAYQQGLSDTPADGSGGQEAAKKPEAGDDKKPDGDGKPPVEGEGDDKKPPTDDKKPTEDKKEGEDDKGKPPVEPPKPGEGEYTKERFDGLMAARQRDRDALVAAEAKVKELTDALTAKSTDPAKPPTQSPNGQQPGADIPIPPALQNADDDAKDAFRTIMSSVSEMTKNMVASEREAIEKAIMDKITAPKREEDRINSIIQKEKEDLTIEFGKKFTDVITEVGAYADKHKYKVGSLRQAFLSYMDVQEARRAAKTVDDFEKDKQKEGDIPNAGRSRQDVIPKFDEKEDGDLSISEVFKKAMKS